MPQYTAHSFSAGQHGQEGSSKSTLSSTTVQSEHVMSDPVIPNQEYFVTSFSAPDVLYPMWTFLHQVSAYFLQTPDIPFLHLCLLQVITTWLFLLPWMFKPLIWIIWMFHPQTLLCHPPFSHPLKWISQHNLLIFLTKQCKLCLSHEQLKLYTKLYSKWTLVIYFCIVFGDQLHKAIIEPRTISCWLDNNRPAKTFLL